MNYRAVLKTQCKFGHASGTKIKVSEIKFQIELNYYKFKIFLKFNLKLN